LPDSLLAVSLTTSRSISLRLQGMVDRSRTGRRRGDLTKRIDITSHDEIGELAKWFNVFMDRMHEMILAITESAEQVAASSEELSPQPADHGQLRRDNGSGEGGLRSRWPGQHQPANCGLGRGGDERHHRRDCQECDGGGAVAGEAVAAAESANRTVSRLGDSSVEIGKVIE